MRPYELRESLYLNKSIPKELIIILVELWEACDDLEYDDSHRVTHELQHLRKYKETK